MIRWNLQAAALLCLACAAGEAAGQSTRPQLKGLPTNLTGGLPALSSINAGNAAGLLGYCLKNKLLAGGNAGSVLDGLTRKPGVVGSRDYAAGLAGQVLNGQSGPVSIAAFPRELKAKACDMVLKKSVGFL